MRHSAGQRARDGKILVLLAVLLPTLLTFLLLVLDGSNVTASFRDAQQVADTAALSGADELFFGSSTAEVETIAREFAEANVSDASAKIEVNCPPLSGNFAGSSNHVEVILREAVRNSFGSSSLGNEETTISARSVAGLKAVTDDSAIIVLDDDPPPFALSPVLPIVPSLPAILGGMEVLGLGRVTVDGAVIVNTDWGGVDEHGENVGENGLPPFGITCMPILPLSKLSATDIRTTGGVDRLQNYSKYGGAGGESVLQANRRPVPDPFRELPVPTLAADAANVKADFHGGRTIVGIPLIGPPITLEPGVYEWITILAGRVRLEPGVYIIRNTDPLTQISLTMLAGEVQADGVMFYITDNAGYSPNVGSPDAADGETRPDGGGLLADVLGLLPSAVVNIGLLGSSISPINDSSSPFDGFSFYQRRQDRRPMVFVQENLLGNGRLEGNVYSKWGHVILAGKGTFDARFIVGTLRIIALLDMDIRPSIDLPPAYDVYLAE
ncbi:pilus assembly protein TadG-related protein [Bremerella sp. JC770]|uniref:pilus assembly protein TadG-related protein n=1 Tax=Bremerella sp. JC770 TaxID=3232137 RepID=UPI003457C744